MKHSVLLTITSLLSIVLFSLHVAGDIVRGIEEGNTSNLPAILIFTVWAYGALMLSERRSGYIIMLLGALLSLAVPILHLKGKGVGGAFAQSEGAFFFIWVLFAIGTTGLFSVILSARGLWGLTWGRRRSIPSPQAS